ncbi:MAG: AMP-binding protein, partial [Verrucomicrobiales bacterium]
MSASCQIHHSDRLPATSCLVIPGRMDANFLPQLRQKLAGREITWLVNEEATLAPEVQAELQNSGLPGISFSAKDPLDESAAAFREVLKNDKALLIYVPGLARARPGTACHIPAETLEFLCSLGL